jgi:hypothetical protein
MAVMAEARELSEVILMPERTLVLLVVWVGWGREGAGYSASNWLGRIRSACWMIFL